MPARPGKTRTRAVAAAASGGGKQESGLLCGRK